jgi:hypothetical protein
MQLADMHYMVILGIFAVQMRIDIDKERDQHDKVRFDAGHPGPLLENQQAPGSSFPASGPALLIKNLTSRFTSS